MFLFLFFFDAGTNCNSQNFHAEIWDCIDFTCHAFWLAQKTHAIPLNQSNKRP